MKKILTLLLFVSFLFSNEKNILDECIIEKNGLSCKQIGDLYKYELGELFLAIKYYDLGCKYSDASSCKNSALGFLLLNEKEKGIYDFKKACSLNNFESCAILGSLYLQGEIVKPNLKFGYLYLLKACNKGKIKNACNIVSTIEKDLLMSKK